MMRRSSALFARLASRSAAAGAETERALAAAAVPLRVASVASSSSLRGASSGSDWCWSSFSAGVGAPAAGFHSSSAACGRRALKNAGRKEKTSLAKAKVYGKIGKQISQAARAGGADPATNSRLAEVLAQAKAAKVPVDLVERNLKRATEKGAEDYIEQLFECYGPGGTSFVIECLTTNANRTISEVRTSVGRGGGKMADGGSVLFSFGRRGKIVVAGDADEDAVVEAALEAGAIDVEREEPDDEADQGGKEPPAPPAHIVWTESTDYGAVRDALLEAKLPVDGERSGLVYSPQTWVEDLDDPTFEANGALLERLLALDDVDAVHHNCKDLEV